MVDAVCSLASWRRLSDQLERVRADLADRINESLADASDSMLDRIPDSTIDSVAQTHIRVHPSRLATEQLVGAVAEISCSNDTFVAIDAQTREGVKEA